MRWLSFIAAVCVVALTTAQSVEERLNILEGQLDGIKLTPGSKGDRGSRGDRGYAGERGERGLCIALNETDGTEISFDCPDAADSDTVRFIQQVVMQLARDLIIRQTDAEQNVRMEGQSGIISTRGYWGGSDAYHDAGFSNYGFANIHDHSDTRFTVGMGEFGAALNGVRFFTRHNDYALNMPSASDTAYGAVEEVPFPDVPPEVLAQPDVASQVTEMQAWFKAWKDQDFSVRDYRPYFRPVISYLEGFWLTNTEALDDPFFSDRHQIDAASWDQLYAKIRFLYQSGRKNNLENLPYLPSSIRGMGGDNGTIPIVANWNYRILVHPISFDIPLNRFRLEDDFHVRMWQNPVSLSDMLKSRRARFTLSPKDEDEFHERHLTGQEQLIDKIMKEIPGLDNYGASLNDRAFGETSVGLGSSEELNTAYYSRHYATLEDDAMGRSERRRSFNDGQMWSAMSTQEQLAGLVVDDENGPPVDPTCDPDMRTCERVPNPVEQKWSYAIPAEIIYLTPLTKWNPYGITLHDDGEAPRAGGRNGHLTNAAMAYDGASERVYYRTPKEFFEPLTGGSDPADTVEGVVGVLDGTGTIRECGASGHWIHFPAIGGGVGEIRQRYPIMPIHEHGSITYKEVQALKKILSGSGILDSTFDTTFGFDFELTIANGHTHTLSLSAYEVTRILDGSSVTITSTTNDGHSHDVTITKVEGGDYTISEMTNSEPHLLKRIVI